MVNDTILTPGKKSSLESEPIQEVNLYLEKNNFLSEYDTEGEKAVVRENLDVYAKDSVYNKLESDIKLDESIKKAFEKYLNEEDPHGILPVVRLMIEGFVKLDGTTPFTAPLKGIDPVQDFHLTTKRFVTKILKDHINDQDPHRILPLVEDILALYVKLSEVYFKDQLYTKGEIDKLSGSYIKKDGSTPFTKALIGSDPLIDSHLATKRYVDKVIYNHLVDIDPHGFVALLNKRLASYAKVNNVWDKTQTYSRVLIDSIIRSLVFDAAKEVINDHLNEFDPHNVLAEVRKEKYIKLDGSVPFKSPQKGVDAVDPQDLVTLRLLESIKDTIGDTEVEWITSGPVEATVGKVEESTKFPEKVTFQEIMDAIFYGLTVSLDVLKYTNITKTCDLTVCIHGSLSLVLSAEIYLNGELIYALSKEDFENGCVTVESKPILEDTTFIFKVTYINDAIHLDEATTKVCMPIFAGLLPKWKPGNTITMEYLSELSKEDPESNQFFAFGKDLSEITIKYKFEDPKLRHPFVVVPNGYPVLDTMTTKSLSFTVDAFDVIDMIPLQIPGVEKDTVYTVYIYRQALASLDLKVTYNFV